MFCFLTVFKYQQSRFLIYLNDLYVKIIFFVYYCVNLQAYYTIDLPMFFLAFIENVFHIKVNQQANWGIQ
jgi:hypothetical protein